MLDWADMRNLDIEFIDDEHEKIFSVMNSLDEISRLQKPQHHVEDVIVDLLSYMQGHFEHEESLMKRFDYPYLLDHVKEHAAMMHIVESYHLFFQRYGDVAIAPNLLAVLKKWFVSHLEETDAPLADFLRRKRDNSPEVEF